MTAAALRVRTAPGRADDGAETAMVIRSSADWLTALDAFGVSSLVACHADELSVTGSLERELRTVRERRTRLALGAETDVATVTRLLHAAGIDHLVLAGPVNALLLERHAAATGGSVPLVWVSSRDRSTAESVLASAGWVAGHGRRCELTHRYRTSLELTTSLADSGPLRHLGLSEALAASVAVPALGPWVRTVDRVTALRHAAQQCRIHSSNWIGAVALVAELADACSSDELRSAERDRTVRLALAAACQLVPRLSTVTRVSWGHALVARVRWSRWGRLGPSVIAEQRLPVPAAQVCARTSSRPSTPVPGPVADTRRVDRHVG